ncbi:MULTISPECIES: DUF3696 domain-containing protein [Bacteroides]|jgi:predicted ATPase|uniref:DUF3696 domain-containing protein n=1 Tax=Bacteroides TaxID=816 RepID=UPI0018A135BD|nr:MULTISPECIES: DUF3696 domain-containing protein [Bacteroides]MBU9952240.1 DUF3696 domain-containing protein [Bacteroides sp. MSK.20.12]MBV3452239.1 DUF3696 domain-containing protein [Bacteroides xylanisolvens]MCS2450590.1 DUF3696 domain-containing protein [Bacteroides thetaiotaomicron]MDC2233091.1 DUF3696 domain-containing protein [Bacteroides thetaiotaomicron]
MIKSTSLKNFKCFQNETRFHFKTINLLTGVNGRGKSSFLQSILLISQSIEDKKTFCKVVFNGQLVNLGSFRDVQNKNTANSNPIEISHETLNGVLTVILERDEIDDTIGLLSTDIDGDITTEFQHVHYIAADRVGPQEFYIKTTLPRFVSVGTRGEYLGNILYQKKAQLVNTLLQEINLKSSNELEIKTGEWLSYILNTENVKVYIDNPENSRIITFSFGIGNSKFRPHNIGFGYSYVLPIVVAGLIAQPGDIIIVENPEAHLHPKAQSNLIYFLSKVAIGGVQIFIESHSEHILNALRVLVKKENLTSEMVSVFFFNEKSKDLYSPIDIKEKGAIDLWPNDFFDQNEIDLKQLVGF